jgi:hypothetical protein
MVHLFPSEPAGEPADLPCSRDKGAKVGVSLYQNQRLKSGAKKQKEKSAKTLVLPVIDVDGKEHLESHHEPMAACFSRSCPEWEMSCLSAVVPIRSPDLGAQRSSLLRI